MFPLHGDAPMALCSKRAMGAMGPLVASITAQYHGTVGQTMLYFEPGKGAGFSQVLHHSVSSLCIWSNFEFISS